MCRDSWPVPDESEYQGVKFPEGGELRIRNLQIVITEDGNAMMPPVTVEVRADVWHHWLSIAEGHARKAQELRDNNPGLAADPAFNVAITEELRESMVAIGAAAFTIEAFHTSVVQHLSERRIHAQSADGRVHQALVRGFRLTNAQSKTERGNLRQVFRLRDRAVHPSAAFAVPIRHPVFPVSMDPKYVAFRCENALAAASYARALVTFCLDHPRANLSELVKWCEAMKARLTEIPAP